MGNSEIGKQIIIIMSLVNIHHVPVIFQICNEHEKDDIFEFYCNLL